MEEREEYFIRTFITKKRQERLLYEFSHPKKRYDGLDRFCHQAKDLLDEKKIVLKGNDGEDKKEFEGFIRKHQGNVLIVSPDPRLDLVETTLAEASEYAVICLDALIIIGEGFALVYAEAEKGYRGRYLLSEEKR